MGQLSLGKGREGGQRLTSKDRIDGKGETVQPRATDQVSKVNIL